MRTLTIRSGARALLPVLLVLSMGQVARGQAVERKDDYAITGGTVVTMAGQTIPGGTVLIQDGRITAVGANVTIPAGVERMDASGLFVYPGLIDAGTGVGLGEAGGMAGAEDRFELGAYNPQIEAYIGVNQGSDLLGAQRVGGITTVVTGLTSGVISGYDSLIDLWGWTPQAMAVRERVGLRLNWPRGGGPALEELRRWFREAKAYPARLEMAEAGRLPGFERDIKLDGLSGAATGTIPVFIQADVEGDIRDAVMFAEEMGLDYVIRGARDAWKMTDFLKEHGTRVLFSGVQASPRQDEPYDVHYATPAILHEAGIPFAIYSNDTAHVFALTYLAGIAVGYGLPIDEAAKAVTIDAARILGVDDDLGSIETGKIANLIITTGNPVEYTTQVRTMFIRGELVPWNDKFSRLYQMYRSRAPEIRP